MYIVQGNSRLTSEKKTKQIYKLQLLMVYESVEN